MKSIYNNQAFFEEYSKMSRSSHGLEGAGEWYLLEPLFPELSHKSVLDLGCGYGWHCAYASKKGANRILGIDLSSKMIEEARKRNNGQGIEYRVCGIEEYEYPAQTWDVVVSNLVLHYIDDLDTVFKKVYQTLKPSGTFLFNIEHPVFTAGVHQDWIYDENGKPLYWPVDNYYIPGKRNTLFLGCEIEKQHHTLTQILMGLIENCFEIEAVVEAGPSEEMIALPGMKDELRRPMMLLVKARKK